MLGFLAELLLQRFSYSSTRFSSYSPRCYSGLALRQSRIPFAVADQPIQSWLRSVYSSSAPQLGSLRVGFFPIRCFGRFGTCRGSVSFLRHLQLGALCTYLDLGASEQVV